MRSGRSLMSFFFFLHFHILALHALLKIFIYFNCRIITILWMFLPYIHGINESAIGIYVSLPSWTSLTPPSPPLPSRSSQSTGFGFPASYIKLPLAILHVVMYVFQCFITDAHLMHAGWSENVNWCSHYRNSMEILQNIKYRTVIWFNYYCYCCCC